MTSNPSILRNESDGRRTFWCPGCDAAHSIRTDDTPGKGPGWGWNGDATSPAFAPSILVQWDSMSQASRDKNQAFYAEHGRYMTMEELPYDEKRVCHSFVEAGNIRFLDDCTHALAGKTVPIPAWDAD